ncbi:flagellar filament capping protein FliD [Chromobacterium sp. IIBBL 290-4]|uniref:flagellar filament capping protein FliD n=1 Tax=Chromobacterium sp. IIBBL 290-4 TaxID=2953890 RepID=UPI0020B7B8ED|nr:flagellar filament capping protein FliD [Chromobacterium sp. IIBBL 290-4]UTH73727.1 flagellar filament capping protein FliD [Chromobacterium sp. IIBBL 290-4]
MSSASISASAGPLDVQSIVSQLVQADSQPLNQSKQRQSNYQSEISTLGQVSSALSGLQTAASTLSSGTFLQQFSATSSDSTVAAVTTTSGGTAGTYVLNVTQMAQARQLVFDNDSSGKPITDENATLSGAPSSLTFNVGGTNSTVQLGSNGSPITLSSIASSINGAGIGVSASIVQYQGNYSLVLNSTQAGSSNAFSITAGGTDSGKTSGNTLAGLQQSATAVSESTAAADALMTVNGVNVSSSSNTVTNVVNGASINLEKMGQTTINMSQNSSGIAQTLQSFISSYNQVVTTVNSATTSSTTVGSTPQNTDISSDLTGLQQQLAGLLGTPIPGADPSTSYAYLAQVGITQGTDGTLSLNQTAFNAALAANPSAVSNLFGNSQNTGIGNVFNNTINSLLGPSGMITIDQNNLNTQVNTETQLQQQLQNQLTNEQSSLLTEYSNLNAELAQMQQASSSMANLITG